jgi:arylsulfatase A-like enzyme
MKYHLLLLFLIPTLVVLFSSPILLSKDQPNVLLIISDDLNTRIGPYMDVDKHTPHLDRLASEGVRFTRAYCQFPLCGPSRASLMSGLHSETNGVLNNNDQPGSFRVETPALANHPSMAGFFREQGYYSARISKIYHMGVPGGIERGDPGGDEPDSWDYAYNVIGPETLSPGKLELLSPLNNHYGGNFSRMVLDDDRQFTQTDYIAVNQAIALLENRVGKLPPSGTNKQKKKPDSPFFLGVGLVRPHVPLIAPASCFQHYPDSEMEIPRVVVGENVPEQAISRQNSKIWGMDVDQKRKTIAGYMASVRFMDQQVGRLLDALDRLEIRDKTIVIFISDHGYNLGEHDCWAKSSLWEGTIRVPLIISHPGFRQNHGTTSDTIVELLDLYPTLTELCGLADKQPKILQGKSLADFITKSGTQQKESQAFTITRGGRGASLRTDRWRYTRWGDNAETANEELYDHHNDPEEFVNLAVNPDWLDVLEDMRAKFESARDKARNGLSRQ